MKIPFSINIDPSKYKSIADNKENYFADIVEIITVISKSEISVGEIIDRFTDFGLLKKGEARLNDSNENWVKRIFQLLNLRSQVFGDNYPFLFDEISVFIELKKGELTISNKLYIQLLISANLPFFAIWQPELTSDFENVSYISLKSYLGGKAVVKKFGKRSEYSGVNTIEKVKKLALDIKLEYSDTDLGLVSILNSNEKGLDLVAWFPFSDYWGNSLVFLGQCACQNIDWYRKESDTTPYLHFFKFKAISPVNVLFIPHSLTRAESFYESIQIKDSLLWDRRRIIEYFDNSKYSDLEVNDIIDYMIGFKESIV